MDWGTLFSLATMTKEFVWTPPPGTEKDLYRLYAAVRVAVENVFADIHDFAVTKMPLRIPPSNEQEILEYHNKIWVVVAALINDFRC